MTSRVLPRSRPSANGSTQQPAPAVVPVRVASRRRPTWMLAGAALVVLCAALAAWVFSTSSERWSVLVAARDVAPGEVVTVADVRVVEVGQLGDARAVRSSQQELVVGLAARGPIPAGTILNTGLVASRDEVIPAGQVVVGVALEPGAAPTASLAVGDRVDVLAVARTTTGAPAAVSPTAARVSSGSVWSVAATGSGSASSKLWVSLLVPVGVQEQVAQAAAEGRLRLSLTGVGS
jgi:hypothetical protein